MTAPPPRLFRPLVGFVSALTLALAGCSGGGSESPRVGSTLSSGSSCALTYTLTTAPLLTGVDPFLSKQWHLNNTGQTDGLVGEDAHVLPAWRLTRGDGVRVAVIDEAVELVHEDLWPNVVPDASHSYRSGNRDSVWPLPCDPESDDHGTAVAGIVAARDDNMVGGAGVAPRAKLVAYDALSTGTDLDLADALQRDDQKNSVYQNSWGSPDDGRLHTAASAIKAAIASSLSQGRSGRGAIYVFPTGNGGCYARDQTTRVCQSDNANFDGYTNQLGIITVCAVDDVGRSPSYAEPGANILLCAPSADSRAQGITTTGLKNTYRDDFSGSSASAPTVSGTVALMLARNPTLTWRDVRLILAETARRNDPNNDGWEVAAQGRAFHHHYGFGVVDAEAAVARAATWDSVGDSRTLKHCESTLRTPNQPIPDAPTDEAPQPLTDSITVSGCSIQQIEFVTLTLSTQHSYSGDLQIALESPAGTRSALAEARQCTPLPNTSDWCGPYTNWTFGSVRHLGEFSNGTWTLRLTDMAPGQVGRLERWSLDIYGR